MSITPSKTYWHTVWREYYDRSTLDPESATITAANIVYEMNKWRKS